MYYFKHTGNMTIKHKSKCHGIALAKLQTRAALSALSIRSHFISPPRRGGNKQAAKMIVCILSFAKHLLIVPLLYEKSECLKRGGSIPSRPSATPPFAAPSHPLMILYFHLCRQQKSHLHFPGIGDFFLSNKSLFNLRLDRGSATAGWPSPKPIMREDTI